MLQCEEKGFVLNLGPRVDLGLDRAVPLVAAAKLWGSGPVRVVTSVRIGR